MQKLFILIGFIQFAFLNPIIGQIPGTINVQGILTNASGQIVANGNYSITFRLYLSAQDNIVLWEEKQENLSVQAGVFSASLGKIKPFTVPFDKTYYLGIQIGLEAELAPRIEMTSTPYSMMAKSVENNSITGAKIQNNVITADKIVPPIISSVNGIINDGGDIKLKAGKNIDVTPDPNDKSISISVTGLDTLSNDVRYVNENQTNVIGQTMIKDNAISAEKIIPNVVSSINNVNNDGGNINIVAGANITILNNDQENTITISAVNPGNTNAGINKINAGNGIAVAGTDGPTAVISVSPNSLTDIEVADKSLSAISLANGAVGNTELQSNAVTVDKIAPNVISSLSGVSNDGGNINLIAGNNVTIVPNDANKTITISASGTGGGTSNFNQLIEGNGIGIQNQFGPNTTIGLKPNILLGPAGSLHILNQNSAAVAGISTSNQGGYLTLSNVQGTQTFGVSNFLDLQPALYLNSRLGRQVVELKANEFSDGEINLKSVLTNTVIRLTSNDNAGGLINVFNQFGNISGQLTTSEAGHGRFLLNSVNNIKVLEMGTIADGAGFLNLANEQGTTAVRLTTSSSLGGRININNRFGNVGAFISTNNLGDGGLFIKSGENLSMIDIRDNQESGSGLFSLYNGDGNETVRISTFTDQQPYVQLINRLGNLSAELTANEFSDGQLSLFSVLENPTVVVGANDNAGGLINVFNQAGLLTAQLTELEDGGFLALSNLDETEMIQLGILPDKNARIRVNNRLGKRVADLISNEFSDGQLTLFSVLENPTVLAGANDNAGGLVSVLHKGGTPSAVMTEIDGYGGVGVFSPTQSPLAAMHGSTNTGFGNFTIYHNNENSIMAQMTRDANENGALGIFNRYQFPIVRLSGNNNSDGQIGIFDVGGLRMAELIRDSISMGGKLSVFNKDSKRSANLMAGFNGSGLLQLYNNLNNLSAGFLAEDSGGKLFISNGSPALSPRVDLSNTETGGQLLLYSKETNLMDQLGVRANGEGYLEIRGKMNYPNPAVLLGGNDNSEGILNLYNNLNKAIAILGPTAANGGTLDLRNKQGITSGQLIAAETGGSLVISDGTAVTNFRASLDNQTNGGRLALFNKESKFVSILQSGANGEAFWRILNKNDATKNRLEMGGDDAGAGYIRLFNNTAVKAADLGSAIDGTGFLSTYSATGKRQSLISNANNGGIVSIFNNTDKIIGTLNTAPNQGGELNIYNVNGANSSKLSNGTTGAGMLEIGTASGDKVARVTTLDGTGYIGLDNVDRKEVVRLTANLGKGGGIGLKNAALFDMINLTQDNNFGAILINNATGGLMTNITHNTAGGAFIGTKDQNGKDAIWLTTGLQGGGHFNTYNTLGKAAITLNADANNIGNLSAHGSAGNELARVSGTSNGIGLVSIFNGAGISLAGLTSGSPSGAGYVYVQNSAGKELARMSTTADGTTGRITIDNSSAINIAGLTSSTSGGYVFANTNSGKQIARMASYASEDGFISVSNSTLAEVSYLSTSNNKGGYIGVTNSTGGERARLFSTASGGGYVNVFNPTGTEVARLTFGGTNNGLVQTTSTTGTVLTTLGSTTTNQGYVGVNSSSGVERVYMMGQDFGGEIGLRDPSGNRKVFLSGAGSMTVTDTDGSYFNASAFGNGVQLFFVDKLQHPRMEVGAGFVSSKGPNGGESSFLSNVVGSQNLGYVGVRNSNVFEGSVEAGMYVNTSGQGVIFADQKNFKIDYPGKPDKQIWYGSLEGPELAAYVRGTGKLTNGKATIEFTDHYQNVANAGTMTVILTPLSGKSKGLAVVNKSSTGFKVEELLEGSGSYEFDWEVKCVRKGHEDFQVVRNKSEDPQSFRSESKLPRGLETRSTGKSEPDNIVTDNTTRQQ